MRVGVNPEKYKFEKNKLRYHRVIIPVFIPKSTDDYYQESIQVFDSCLNSLFQTINFSTTAVTVVNNGSSEGVSSKLNNLLKEGVIDKLVDFSDNRGKVYAALSEARASYEPYITISDADVLFFSNWEKAVFKIYKSFPKAGVVSPLPSQNLALYKNNSVFFDKFAAGKIKYAKKVSDEDCELFLKGMGNMALHKRINRPFSWKEKQYFLEKNAVAILGANHFVATYRKEIFKVNSIFPVEKFSKGYEEYFLDDIADKAGFYRLSTPSTYAFHMGNKMDEFIEQINFSENEKIEERIFSEIDKPKESKIPYFLKTFFFRVLRRTKKL